MLKNPERSVKTASNTAFFVAIWDSYKRFIKDAIYDNESHTHLRNIDYWRDSFFTNCVIFSFPFSFIALIPSVIIAYREGYRFILFIDPVTLAAICFIVLNKRFSLLFRKAFVVFALYLLAVVLIGYLGDFGIGSIYLLAMSVFIALLFPYRVVYASVVVNLAIYAFFSAVIYFKLFDSPLIGRYNFSVWIAYAMNMIFLNLAIIVQIRYAIGGLERTIQQGTAVLGKLRTEVTEKAHRNKLLKESEDHYRSLFFLNPSPMWIYDAQTLAFLQVNDAAIERYGYQEDEFMRMTIKDIRLPERTGQLERILREKPNTSETTMSIVQHCNRSGVEFYVEVRCNPIKFKGKDARLVIARNINDQINYIQAIEKQNDKLHTIAYMQSHIVRAPLARIMALTDMIINDRKSNQTDDTVLSYLEISVKELDAVVHEIVDHTEQILPDISEISNPWIEKLKEI